MIGFSTLMVCLVLGSDRFSELITEHSTKPLKAIKHLQSNSDETNCKAILDHLEVKYTYLGNRNYSDNPACMIRDAVKISGSRKATLNEPVITSCVTAIQLSRWLDEIEVVKVAHLGSYNCRKIRNSSTLSQHSFAKAIDITSLDDALVAQHWDDSGLQGQKLRTAALKACKYFSTILTPKSNKLHEKHFHLDNKPGLYKKWTYWFGCK